MMGAIAYNPSDKSPFTRETHPPGFNAAFPPFTVYYCTPDDPSTEVPIVIITDQNGMDNWVFLAKRFTLLGTFDTFEAAYDCAMPHFQFLKAAYLES